MIVAFVATVVGTRWYLDATGYPQIGGGDIHVAHVLWGGLLLVAGSMLVLIVDGGRALAGAAILAGVGTGLFIDELGKFITASNDYFYPLAAPLIYGLILTLVVVLLVLRRRPDRGPLMMRSEALVRLEAGLLTRVRARRLLAGALGLYGLGWVLSMVVVGLLDAATLQDLIEELLQASTSRVEYPSEPVFYVLEVGILGFSGALLVLSSITLGLGRESAGTAIAVVGLAVALTAGAVVSLYVEQISAITTTLVSAFLLIAVVRYRGRFLERTA